MKQTTSNTMVEEPRLPIKGGWHNVQESCPLCKMDKKTEWYYETPWFVVADTLHGSPFVVSKRHITQENFTQQEYEAAHNTARVVFGQCDLTVLMNIVEDHWHAFINNREHEAFEHWEL